MPGSPETCAPLDGLDLDEPIHANLNSLLAGSDILPVNTEEEDDFAIYYHERPAPASISSSQPAFNRLVEGAEPQEASSYQEPTEDTYLDADILPGEKLSGRIATAMTPSTSAASAAHLGHLRPSTVSSRRRTGPTLTSTLYLSCNWTSTSLGPPRLRPALRNGPLLGPVRKSSSPPTRRLLSAAVLRATTSRRTTRIASPSPEPRSCDRVSWVWTRRILAR